MASGSLFSHRASICPWHGCVLHWHRHGTSDSTSSETTLPPVPMETSGGVLSTVDTVVQRRDDLAGCATMMMMMMISPPAVSEAQARRAYVLLLFYFLLHFGDFFQTDYLSIYGIDLREISRTGRTLAADERSKLFFSISQGTLPWQLILWSKSTSNPHLLVRMTFARAAP